MTQTATQAPTAAEEPSVRQSFPIRLTRRKLVVLGVALVALMVALGWLLSWWSPVPIREVRVTGAAPEMESEILRTAAIQVGTPIRDIDVQDVTMRVDALPGIEATALTLVRPWTVTIDVVERFPFAVVRSETGWSVLDEFGGTIREVPKRPEALPSLTATPEQYPLILPVVAALPEDLRREVASVSVAGDPAEVQFTLDSGASVDWGAPTRSQEKAAVLSSLLSVKAEGYVVRVPERPALTGDMDLPKENRSRPEEPVIP